MTEFGSANRPHWSREAERNINQRSSLTRSPMTEREREREPAITPGGLGLSTREAAVRISDHGINGITDENGAKGTAKISREKDKITRTRRQDPATSFYSQQGATPDPPFSFGGVWRPC